jgi:hypothetical protein
MTGPTGRRAAVLAGRSGGASSATRVSELIVRERRREGSGGGRGKFATVSLPSDAACLLFCCPHTCLLLSAALPSPHAPLPPPLRPLRRSSFVPALLARNTLQPLTRRFRATDDSQSREREHQGVAGWARVTGEERGMLVSASSTSDCPPLFLLSILSPSFPSTTLSLVVLFLFLLRSLCSFFAASSSFALLTFGLFPPFESLDMPPAATHELSVGIDWRNLPNAIDNGPWYKNKGQRKLIFFTSIICPSALSPPLSSAPANASPLA